jgi:hypothetical protein
VPRVAVVDAPQHFDQPLDFGHWNLANLTDLMNQLDETPNPPNPART